MNYEYNKDTSSYLVHCKQLAPKGNENSPFFPLHIPIKIAFIYGDVSHKNESIDQTPNSKEYLLELSGEEAWYTFTSLPQGAALSINRNFTAPVRIISPASFDDLVRLIAFDSDAFSRYESVQTVAIQLVQLAGEKSGVYRSNMSKYCSSLEMMLTDTAISNGMKALLLRVPTHADLEALQEVISFEQNETSIESYKKDVGSILYPFMKQRLESLLKECDEEGMKGEHARSLFAAFTTFLIAADTAATIELLSAVYNDAKTMTMRYNALAKINSKDCVQRETILSDFLSKYKDTPSVVCKYFLLQSQAPARIALKQVKTCMQSSHFDITVPNMVRSVLGGFIENRCAMHASSGEGYRFIAEMVVKLDALNPLIAASLAKAFNMLSKVDGERKTIMLEAMNFILASPKLSHNVYEIVSNAKNKQK